MSRITELINCVKIYNLCNHCDHFKCGECSVDDVNCKEEIEKQITSEIREDAIKEFGNWLFENGYDSSSHNIKAWITEYNLRDKVAEQLKEGENNV